VRQMIGDGVIKQIYRGIRHFQKHGVALLRPAISSHQDLRAIQRPISPRKDSQALGVRRFGHQSVQTASSTPRIGAFLKSPLAQYAGSCRNAATKER
jgi:hypothetical protein